MTKHILVFIGSFNIGGTTTSLNSLLSVLDPNRLSVDVYAFNHTGDFENSFSNCKILKPNPWMAGSSSGMSIFCLLKYAFVKAIGKVFNFLVKDYQDICFRIGSAQLNTKKYDAIVSFQENITKDVAKIPSKQRIAWIHSDYSRFLSLIQEKRGINDEKDVYQNMDKIVCVSKYSKNNFVEIYPDFSSKTVAIHNVINVEDINKKAKESINDDRFITKQFTIVSCGRLDPVKQFHLIPRIATEIREKKGDAFKWYIIGGGNEEEKQIIETEIKKYNIDRQVVLLGAKANPYPYIAQSNLYVCISVSESFPMVINEAKALRVPIVSSDFPSVYESVEDGIDGYVVKIEEMADKIAYLMDNPLSIISCRIDNSEIINKVYDLFNA